MKKTFAWLFGVAVLLILTGAVFFLVSPSLFLYRAASIFTLPAELEKKPELASQVKWHDDYYAVEYLDDQTVAIAEPRYWQKNISYLIMGKTRAILLDGGPGNRDIRALVRSMTDLPILALASHLHYDHVNGLRGFESIGMLDLPALRQQVDEEGFLDIMPEQHLGSVESLSAPRLRVNPWLNAGTILDLGARKVKVLATPGHTADSLMLYDVERKQLFTGDFIYPGFLLAILPGAHLGQYLASATMLATEVAPDVTIFPGHGEGGLIPWQTPRLEQGDLVDLQKTLQSMREGALAAGGLFPRQFRVNEHIDLLTAFPWNMEWQALAPVLEAN